MATFREAVYMVLDLIKQVSDDAYYTEEHIMFLLSKARAALLEKKYEASRNQSFQEVDKSNYQSIKYDLEKLPTYGRGDVYVGVDESGERKVVPKLIPSTPVYAFPDKNLTNEFVSFVPAERLPFVGYNKWLRKFIYCAVSNDNELYVKDVGGYHEPLDSIYLYGEFADPAEVSDMSSDPEDMNTPDVLDRKFPLEEALMASCIEYVVQLLTGSKFSPEDRRNNGKDDMSDMSVSTKQPQKDGD